MKEEGKITIRAMVLGAVFAGVFSAFTVFSENHTRLIPTSCQIAVLPYVLLVLITLMVNPVCKLIRFIRVFTVTEILIVFIMGSVSAGVSTFGLASQVVPVISGLFNGHWNNDQSEWNRYVEPVLNESWFLSEQGIQEAALKYRDSLQHLKAVQATSDAAATRSAESDMLDSKRSLRELETKAFAKVELFRRGLPKDMRSFPGFVMLPGENAEIYFGRLRRLTGGLAALEPLRACERELKVADQSQPVSPSLAARIDAAIEAALCHLGPLADATVIKTRAGDFANQWAGENDRQLRIIKRLDYLRQQRWSAMPAEFGRIDSELRRLTRESADLEELKSAAARSGNLLQAQLDSTAIVAAACADLRSLREASRHPLDLQTGIASRRLDSIIGQFPAFDASLRRFLIGEVPWGEWAGPLSRWALVIGITYLVLMAFNVLIFRQWAHNEKLIYPLAELPKILCGADGQSGNGLVPKVFRSGLFWAGFTVSAGFLGWNLLASSQLVPGIAPIDLGFLWQPYIRNSIFKGLLNSRSVIFFTMIGLAFLIPAEISFSLWFFTILYMGQTLVLIWTGYGVNEGSFQWDWWYTLNFRTAEGFGALMIFSALIIFKCRRYIFCCFSRSAVKELEKAERTELRISSFLFLAGSVALIMLIWQGMGASLFYTVLGYVVILMITIGLVRAVTEGGILGFQAWISPFHLIRTLFGMDKTWSSPSLFAPLFAYYSVLFLDIKAFMAPAMANSIKIRDDLKMGRLRFHVGVALGIIIAAAVAIIGHIMMCYGKGADSMHEWFYAESPQAVYDNISSMMKNAPIDTTANSWWIGLGAAGMAALLFLRQMFFWLPHPIGLVMLVNPIMNAYWFSIMLGWLAKRMVTKYGNKETYGTAKNFFIGLIAGELLLVVASMAVSIVTGTTTGIDLNRSP